MIGKQAAKPKGSTLSYDEFNAAVPAPPEKYFLAMFSRSDAYRGFRMRCYLCPNLEPWIPWLLNDVGFDEVFLMKHAATGFYPGMLWRYLPILEPCDQVVCTGLDRYSPCLHKELLRPVDAIRAVIAVNRIFLPFAGPLSVNPGWLDSRFSVQADRLMTAFGHDWNAAKRNGLTGIRESQPKIVDAAFLTRLLWHREIVTDKACEFTDRSFIRFAKGITVVARDFWSTL